MFEKKRRGLDLMFEVTECLKKGHQGEMEYSNNSSSKFFLRERDETTIHYDWE